MYQPIGKLKLEKHSVALLAVGHFITDSYGGFLAPLLPLLVVKFDLSLALSGALASTLSFSSSLIQPVYGYLADRSRTRSFVVFGPLLAALSLSTIGLAPSYPWLIGVVLLGGVGIAAFHPQAAVMAGQRSGSQRGLGLSIFSAGGTVGYATGPMIILPIVFAYGLDRTYLAILPGVIIAVLLYRFAPSTTPASVAEGEEDGSFRLRVVVRPHLKSLLLLWAIAALRSMTAMGFATFLALLFEERGASLMIGGAAITVFLASGAVGGPLGGYLSDRLGGWWVVLLSLVFPVPLLYLFLHGSGTGALILLALAGMTLLSSIPVNIVMAQELVPQSAGTVSSLMMGFAFGTGGLMLPLIGILADAIGVTGALYLVAAIPVLGVLLVLKLPRGVTR
ncbi:MAG: MFS transporter [Candidatus Bipolaricaulia bacterium]